MFNDQQDDLIYELKDKIKELESKLKIATDSLEKIRSGLTTEQSKVEFYTKILAYETLEEIKVK